MEGAPPWLLCCCLVCLAGRSFCVFWWSCRSRLDDGPTRKVSRDRSHTEEKGKEDVMPVTIIWEPVRFTVGFFKGMI